jgi:hypothetical protein
MGVCLYVRTSRQQKLGGWESEGRSVIGRAAEANGQMIRRPGWSWGRGGNVSWDDLLLGGLSWFLLFSKWLSLIDGLRSTVS